MDDLTGIPEDPQEAALALLHSRAEVARLKEREQLFSALLASVNSVLWAYDWQNRRMVYVSPAYEKIFGRSAALLLADYEEWRNSIYPDDLDYADSSLLQVLERGAVEQREYRIVRGDGEVRWLNDKCFVSRQGEAALPLWAIRWRTWSPTWWPKRSLIFLKSSTSSSRNANGIPSRRHSLKAASALSKK